ncbi:MAG: PAS domain S-box protein [Haloarculaceae archaeon]
MPDVTGDRLGELREAEERLRLVAENVDEVVLIAAADLSEIQYVTPAYEELYGQPVERLYERPRSFLESVHPEDRDAYEADVEAMLADFERDDPESVYEGEYRLQGEASEWPRWIHVSRYPVLEDDGEDGTGAESGDGEGSTVERFVVVVEEITERREYERAYREVFEGVSDGLVVHDPETGEILDVNERFCGMNGYERDELVGETVGLVTADETGHSYEEANRHVRRAREEGPQLFEWRNERKDGSTFPVEVHLAAVEIMGEERVLGSVSDITERKRREQEYEQIFNEVNDAISVHDPETGEILEVNDTYVEEFGYDESTILELGVEGLSVTEAGYTGERSREIIREVAGTGESVTVEWLVETADGERRWYEVDTTRARIGGELRVLGISRDVTARKRRERITESLHASTERIQEAGTTEAVCEATVTAMEEVLDLSLPVCWLQRDDPARLEPVAASGAAREFAGGPGPLESGTFEYGLYERGETAVYDPSERWDRTSLTHALMVPIGEHGVIGAAEPGVEEFDDVVLDAARILARHTTTALDRVERGRELRESERRFRLIAERIDEVIFLAEPDFSELFYVNEAYEELWGQPVEALFDDPRGFVDRIDPRDREAFEADFEGMLADIDSGEPDDSYTFEFRVRRGDGTVRWVRATGYPVELDGGESGGGDGDTETRFVGIVEDVTERRELERTYRAVFENVSDGLVVHEPETGEILDVNERYCELTGYSEDELVGGNVRLIVPEDPTDTYEDAQARIEEAREAGPQLFEFEGECKDGERFVGEVHLSTVEIRGEECVLASVRDVTERKRRKRELRQLTEEYETIFGNAQDALFLVDVERTDEGMEFVYRRTNRAYEEQTGVPSETVVGKNPRELIGEEGGTRIEANYRRCVEGRETITYEEELELPTGSKVWQTKLSPVVIGGDVTQVVGIGRDVTEQREREETLETFHDTTRELVSAGSRREASDLAVTAAERVLGFPLVSVHLYDEEAGTLEPVAATGTLESVLDVLPSYDPGESLPWQVFVDGETVRTSEVERSPGVYGRAVSDPDVVLSLGSHGVMLVGAPDREFDAETIELAQILAATLQAALGHVQGQRELEARESELEAHRERADRLERLNTVIREIEQATVEESSREGIERAVCEHLTTVEPYREAWIAEPELAGDTLVTRASHSDGGGGYAETLAVDFGGDGVSDHPSATSYETGEVRIVRSLATSTAHGDWRKPALRAGYQSMIAVPLAGRETVHGVLSIAADDPAAFDEDTEEILAELGRSVGHAVSVLERRAALESDTTTELEFEVADEALSVVWLATETGAEVTLERTVRRPGGEFGAFYTVEGADPERVVERADAAPEAETAHVVSEDEEACLVEVRTSSWFGTTFTEYGAVVRTARAEYRDGNGDGGGRLVVEAPQAADVRTLVESFRERYPETELVAQRTRERAVQTLLELQDLLAEQLTPRQLEALETAYSAGYFDWPRESSGEDIADLLGVTQPTFNKHLRSAERKAFSMLLNREYPE